MDTTIVLTIEGISCEHCVKTVTNAVDGLSGVEWISVDLDTQKAIVEYNPMLVNIDTIKSAIEGEGYRVVA